MCKARFFFLWVHAKSLPSCLTLCNPVDHSPPGSSVHGILQGRILEWVAMPSSSRGSSRPVNQISLLHWQAGSLLLSHLASPHTTLSDWTPITNSVWPEPLLLWFSRQGVSDCSPPHGQQHARPLCLPPSPGVCPSSDPLNLFNLEYNWSSVS